MREDPLRLPEKLRTVNGHALAAVEDDGDAVPPIPLHHLPGDDLARDLLPAVETVATAIAPTVLPTIEEDSATTTAIEDHHLRIIAIILHRIIAIIHRRLATEVSRPTTAFEDRHLLSATATDPFLPLRTFLTPGAVETETDPVRHPAVAMVAAAMKARRAYPC